MRKPISSLLSLNLTVSLCLRGWGGEFFFTLPRGRWVSAMLTAYKKITRWCWGVGHFMTTLRHDRWAVCYCHSLEFKNPSCLLSKWEEPGERWWVELLQDGKIRSREMKRDIKKGWDEWSLDINAVVWQRREKSVDECSFENTYYTIPSKMKRMQHAMTRTVAKEDKKQEKNERDRLETAEACQRKKEWVREGIHPIM